MKKPLTINLGCEQQSLPSTFLKAKPSLSLKNSVPLVNCLILNELLCSLEVISKKKKPTTFQVRLFRATGSPSYMSLVTVTNTQKLALSTWHRQMSYSLRIIAQDSFLAADESCSQTLACQPMQQTKLNLWLSPSAKQHQNHCSGPPPALQDLSKQHDCLVKRAVVDFLIRMKGNSKCLSGNLLDP